MNIFMDENPGKTPKSTELLEKLREEILTGRLKPGHKIIEQELCREYGVSRTPVREALKQLETDGLMEYILNRGAFVKGMSQQEFRDMLDLRRILEIQAVRWAIERITREEMERLDEAFEFMEFYTMRGDIEKMLVINSSFHSIIHEAARNSQLQRQLNSYQNILKYVGVEAVQSENYLTTVLEEHRAIFRAFVAGDVREGALAMEMHMNRSRERRCE